MERKPWMDQEPPLNYVAGLGRGATGFTTRSDIGPARPASEAPTPTPAPAPVAKKEDDDDDNEKEDYSESNYDEWGGYGGSFNDPNAAYEKDDEEADLIWDQVDKKMDSKRKERRERLERERVLKYRQERPKIQQQFADLKKELGLLSNADWDSIPEIGNTTARFRKKVKTNLGFLPVPDSVLEKGKIENEQFTSLDIKQQKYGGLETPMDQTPANLTELGDARTKLLQINLGKMAQTVMGQTVVDTTGYLTDLNSIKISSEAELGDQKKARLLLKSVRQTNPKHAPSWIASARLEEVVGKLAAARKLIIQGTQECPESDDVWIEAARLHTPDIAKGILAKAIKHVPKSVKVWLQAASLETDIKLKKRVLRKALEFVPNSVPLWKAAIELEEPEDAKILLGRAVECVPHNVEMWLALAHLETYENARKVLNKAREAIPTDASIWVTAAKLEEAHGNEEVVKAIIKRAIKSLMTHQVSIERDQWIKDAEEAEKAGAKATCQTIIRESIHIGIEDEDRKRVWIEDADNALAHGCVETARAIYAVALSVFPAKKSLWLRVAHLEKAHGTAATLNDVLKNAVAKCEKAEILWLMAAKERWLQDDVHGAREILKEAFAKNSNSEQIWLAAVKLESEKNEYDRARGLLKRARERAGTERVWMKSALLERQLGDSNAEIQLLDESLKKYPQFPKFWMMRGQVEERLGKTDSAKEMYQRGLKNCPHSIPLWLCAVNLEEKFGIAKARSLLEKARTMNQKNPDLWLAAIRIENRAGNHKVAQTMLAKALQECLTSGILWAETIEMENHAQKKAKSVDALKKCDNDPHVILAVAKIFWVDRKLDKARAWLNRAVTLNPDLGDAWAYFYKFELQHGNEEQQKSVLKRGTEAEPHHGEQWIKVSKDPNNVRLKTDEILKKVAASLPNLE